MAPLRSIAPHGPPTNVPSALNSKAAVVPEWASDVTFHVPTIEHGQSGSSDNGTHSQVPAQQAGGPPPEGAPLGPMQVAQLRTGNGYEPQAAGPGPSGGAGASGPPSAGAAGGAAPAGPSTCAPHAGARQRTQRRQPRQRRRTSAWAGRGCLL